MTSLDFSSCSSLDEINGFQNCSGITSVTLGNITKIGQNAFKGCSKLTDFDFSSITSIGVSSFEGCSSLVTAKFNSKNFELSKYAFKNCTSLKSVIFLGDSDGGYQDSPFEGCTSLVLVVFNSGFDKSLDTQIFKGLTQFATTGNGIICIDQAYDSTGLGNFIKISDTYTAKVAYSSASGSVAAGTLVWSWTDSSTKESVTYHAYNVSNTTTVPSSFIKRRVEETYYL